MEQGQEIEKKGGDQQVVRPTFEKPAGRYMLVKPSEREIRGPKTQQEIIKEVENNKKLLEELTIYMTSASVSPHEGDKERVMGLFQQLIDSQEYRVDFIRNAGNHLAKMSETVQRIKGINDQPKKEEGLIKGIMNRIKKM